MYKESELTSKVAEFLQGNGYPRESIVLEYALPRSAGQVGRRADIAIVDPKQLQPMALIEIKTHSFSQALYKEAFRQIQHYASCLRYPVRKYIIFATKNQFGLLIYDATIDKYGKNPDFVDNIQAATPPNIISFTDLIQWYKAERLNAENEEKGKHRDALVWRRWVGIVVLCTLFAQDYCRNGGRLSWESLSVLCGAFILWLLPYFDVISFRDVTLQRHQDNEEK